MNMKRTIPLFAAFFLFAFLWTQSPAQAADPIFINEIHYDNLDADTNEGVEIAGPAGTDLSGWKIFLYNGASTQLKVYDTINLSGTISDQCNGYGTLHFTRAGIQNGAPDGLALVNAANTVIQFLSYEGVFAPIDGPASGMPSVDIGVSENNSTPVGYSLQLSGAGTNYEDFTWQAPATSSFGSCNPGQTFTGGGDIAPTVISTSPANGASLVPVTTAITINFSEAVDATASAFSLECPSGTAVPFTTSPLLPGSGSSFTLTPTSDLPNSTTCEVTVAAAQISEKDIPVEYMAADYTFSFTTANPGGIIYIHDVQGSGSSVTLSGTVTVEGVVVGDYQENDELSGFFIQEEDSDADANIATSEGIFVYCNACGTAVSEGQIVSVTGTAEEFNNNSQIDVTDPGGSMNVTNTGNNMLLVTPVILSLPFPPDVSGIPYQETIENMRVIVPADLLVTELYNLGRGGAFILSSGDRLYQPTEVILPSNTTAVTALTELNNRNQIVIDDGSLSENPPTVIHPAPALSLTNRVRNGDTLAAPVTGVLTYRYYGWAASDDAYRIYPTNGGASFNSINPRSATPPSVGTADIKVASFNVLNYFNGNGLGSGFPTTRGADTYSEFIRQRNKIIAAITILDADIIGLMEIENDGYGSTSAIQDLVNGLNDATAPGTYAFVNPGVAQIGTDEIAVGLLYKQNAVSTSGTAKILDSSVDSNFNSSRNRPALAQTFTYDAAPTQKLTVAVNHLKSKGTDCDAIGDPDIGDGQGNCNITRTTAATAEAAWLLTDPTSSEDSDFLVIGDLNSYSMEDPIMAFVNGGFVNLTAGFESEYSYVFKGQFGHLDHALATPSLVSQVSGTAVWHINADEPPAFDYNNYNQAALYAPDAYRASDHDPVLIGIDFDQQSDFSDAASSYGFAWNTGSGTLRLGSLWDADTSFTLNSDNASDDGVSVGDGSGSGGQWQPGPGGGSLDIVITDAGAGSNGCLYAWIDWNGDDLFDNTDSVTNLEYIIRHEETGSGNYTFEVPANEFLPPGSSGGSTQSYNLRVRLYGACSSGPAGAGIGGEVEDYVITFSPTAVTLQSFSATDQNTLWLAVLLVIVTLVAGSLLMWLNGRFRT